MNTCWKTTDLTNPGLRITNMKTDWWKSLEAEWPDDVHELLIRRSICETGRWKFTMAWKGAIVFAETLAGLAENSINLLRQMKSPKFEKQMKSEAARIQKMIDNGLIKFSGDRQTMIDTTPKSPREYVFLGGQLERLLEAVYDAGWYDRQDARKPFRRWYLFDDRLKAAGGDLTRVDVWEEDGSKVKP